MTEHRARSRTYRAILRRPITALTTIALLCQSLIPAYAQIVADPAAGARQPGLDRAANGTPIVNITTPNASGLSHNKFTDFNVGASGVVLNNSAELSSSQIAGLVLGNTNLVKGSEASLILNEVTGTNRSQLSGYLEVNGRAASVIVANPNGITCSGCGFINMPRATLTTGRPVLDGAGNPTSFDVEGGSIVIGAEGLDATRLSRFELISRAIEINGALQAQDLTVSGGRQSYDYASGMASAIAPDNAPKPVVFLDASALGGMYANRIRIVGNEFGLGIRAPKLGAAAGELSVEAQGHVVLSDASASGAVTIRSTNDAVDFSGTAYSEQDLTATAASAVTIANGALAGARGRVALTGQSLALGAGTIAAGLASDGTLTANTGTAQLRFSGAASIAAGGLLHGGDRLDASLGSLANAGTVQADSSLALFTARDIVNDGRFLSTGGLELRSGHDLTSSGTGSIEAGGDLDLAAAATLAADGAIRATGDATLSAASLRVASAQVGRDLVIAAPNLTITGSVAAGGTGTVTAARSFKVLGSATLGAVGNLDINGDAITNAGSIISEGALSLASASPAALVLTNAATGRMAGGSSLTASFASLSNSGIITSNGALSLAGGSFENAQEVTTQDLLTLRAAMVSNSGTISAARLDAVSTGAFANAAVGIVQATGSSAISAATIMNGGRLVSNDAISLATGSLSNEGGMIVAGSDLTVGGLALGSTTGSIANLSGQIGSVSGDIRLTAQAIDNRAAILAGRDLVLVASRIDGTSDASFEAGRDLTVNGPAALSAASAFRANRDIQIAAGAITATQIAAGGNLALAGATLDNVGSVVAGDAADLRFTTSIANRAGATIGAANSLSIVGPLLDNAGTLSSQGSVMLTGGTPALTGELQNRTSGRIAAGTTLDGFYASVDNAGVVTSAGSLTLAGSRLTNAKEVTADGAVSLRFATIDHPGMTSGGSVAVVGTDIVGVGADGVIQATNALTVQSAALTNLGLLASGGTLLASVGSLTNDHSSIVSRGDLTIEGLTAGSRAEAVNNLSGDIESVQGNITLRAEALNNAGDGVTDLRTTEIDHQFITGQKPPPNLAYYPDLISKAGYDQLYDGGRTREYVFVPSPEEVNIILAAEGITIDQWTPTLWQKYQPDPRTFDPKLWAIFVPDESRHAPAGSYVAARDESDVIVKANEPGQVITGAGNIHIDAGVLKNTQSTISANGDLSLTGGSVVNEGKTLTRSYSLGLSYNNDTVRVEGSLSPDRTPIQFFDRGDHGPRLIRQETTGVIPSTINATGTISGNLSGSFVNVGTPATDPATLSFANTSTTIVTVTQAPPAASVSMAALAGTSGSGADVTSGGTIPTEVTIPTSQLKQFAPANDSSRFVIETRLPFINPADYFGSDYFFDRLGFRPDDRLKTLGDAYFDTIAVRDQMLDLTGRRFIGSDVATDQQQMKQLIENAASELKRLGIPAGRALSSDEQAQLTKDVVVYVPTRLPDGQNVYIPQLYLSNATRTKLGVDAARISSRTTELAALILINENGSIVGDERLNIKAIQISGLGGSFGGGAVDLTASQAILFDRDIGATGNNSDKVGTRIGRQTRIQGQVVSLKAPTIELRGVTAIANQDLNITATNLKITPAEAAAHYAYTSKNATLQSSQNLLLLSDLEAGGSINIAAANTAFISAATLKAGDNVRIHAGQLFIGSGEQGSSSSGQLVKHGFTKSTTSWDSLVVTQIPSVVEAKNKIEFTTTIGDTIISASILKADEVAIGARGQIRIEAANNEVRSENARSGHNAFIATAKGKGHDYTTPQQSQINARQVSFTADQGIVIQVRSTDSLEQAIADLSQFKEFAYLDKVKGRSDVTFEKVQAAFKDWNYHQVGLSAPAAAVLAVAVAIATNGAGASLVGASSGFGGALANAGFSSLASSALRSVGQHLNDPGAALRALGSDETARAFATSVVTAGILEQLGLNGCVEAVDCAAANKQPWDERVLTGLRDDLTRSGVKASITSGLGKEFARDFVDELKIEALATIGSEAQFQIGCAAHGGPNCGPNGSADFWHEPHIDDLARYIGHAAVGCAVGAVSGGCKNVAIGEVAGEATAEFIGDQIAKAAADQKKIHLEDVKAWQARGADLAQLSGALAAALAGADSEGITQAGVEGGQAARNNIIPYILFEVFVAVAEAAAESELAAEGGALVIQGTEAVETYAIRRCVASATCEAKIRIAAEQLGITLKDTAIGQIMMSDDATKKGEESNTAISSGSVPAGTPTPPIDPSDPEKDNATQPGVGGRTAADLLNAGAEIDPADASGQLTKAGRALQKHGNRKDSAFPESKGSPADINRQGQETLDNILKDPESKITTGTAPRFGKVIEVIGPRGGARFDDRGNFIGFLEPGK